eukprot:CAMPEP_0202720626 /NCGR_PEP_ID=MMETSP1385-20130828/141769_1 /ASSEMBLY_ACC=CAM_ASM_000861 /TAXON_ID=933848 /ORGANISM="Elphidium margaritaceum" /LENGTH=101 /DNA_ID=CAMNT_0049384445 /DNA_START=51 /DNA_END=353 /DNA_ORIENTATION=+
MQIQHNEHMNKNDDGGSSGGGSSDSSTRGDKYCENGILSRGRQPGHCRVCCATECGRCGGSDCSKKSDVCCIGTILRARRPCDKYPAPCEMTLRWHCPSES